MRATSVAAAFALAFGGAAAEGQHPARRQIGVAPQTPSVAPRPVQPAPAAPQVRQAQPSAPIVTDGGYGYGGHVHDGHHHHGGRVFGPYGGGYGYGAGYGLGYAPYGYGYGYEGISVGGPGYGFNYYRGPAYGGFPINPPVFTYPPIGYGTTFGYGTAFGPGYVGGIDPLNNSLLQYQYENDWNVLSAKAAELALKNEGDPTAGATAIPVPSSREAKLKSLRYQAQGDEAFRRQDFVKAAGLYRQAFNTAKDNGAAFMRLGYAHVATGQLASALEHFKRGLAVEPALVLTGPTPDELYGPDQQLAWNAHLGRVTRWVAEDVRDANRVFLLGILLYYDGDTRAAEFLTKAWQLSGGTETAILPLLNPPRVGEVKVKEEVVESPLETAPPLGQAGEAAHGEVTPGPVIPAPPAAEETEEAPAGRPGGQAPLFPLPSEQGSEPVDPAAPPLPAPATEDNAVEPR